MRRGSPIVWIAFGLVSLTITLLLFSNLIVPVAPDQSQEVFWYRKSLAETLAVQYSRLAERNDLDTMNVTMQALVDRNDRILSVALRRYQGEILSEAGHHQQHWIRPQGDASTFDHIQVPIMNGEVRWGTLEIAFRPQSDSIIGGILDNPWFQFLGLVAVLGYLGYLFFMKKTLKQLDPSAVVPGRVRTALDVLPVGVVLTDPLDRIVLANKTFSSRVGMEPLALIGQDLCDFAWGGGADKKNPDQYPWIAARKTQHAVPGVPLTLEGATGDQVHFVATSLPILDERGTLRGVLASFHDVTELDHANSQLREAIDELESSRAQVLEQNQQLEKTNEALHVEMGERQRVQAEREELSKKLIETSRRVGMADVASTVLHNVGNVLNSVNVSVDVVRKTLRQSPIGDVGMIAQMLKEHAHDLGAYLSEDDRGKQIPSYLEVLAETVKSNSGLVETELGSLSKNIEHIRQVVTRQVDLARPGEILHEAVRFADLFDQALEINRAALEAGRIQVVQEYADLPTGMTDQHQVLQILVNLISNAKNAMLEAPASQHRLTLRLGAADSRQEFVRFEVSDSGVGIKPENLSRLFTQGFTTRPQGHGIGLHSAALAAKNLGGSLRARSDGEGQGATFTLDLPLQPLEAAA